MDMRTGEVYGSIEEARQAGVPSEELAPVEELSERLVRVTSGPFSGRVYEKRSPYQTVRRKDLEE